ncbi:MAG: phosphoribosyltransferase [Negativicutes bacterium]|nr:phosphoribosyltransferase [Negativicutes bacterium]
MRFRDRTDAGIRLANALAKYQSEDLIIYALPRGGVPLGVEIAKRLNAPLDLLITKKIGHPRNPEYAIGAITEDGDPVCNQEEVEWVDRQWLEEETARLRLEIKRRREKYFGEIVQHPIEGKTVIIVDDGIATGYTMFASINEIKKRKPSKIVVAIPVTPEDIANKLRAIVDDLVSVQIDPFYLGAVGAYYDDFSQVEDEEVIALLKSVAGQGGL